MNDDIYAVAAVDDVEAVDVDDDDDDDDSNGSADFYSNDVD